MPEFLRTTVDKFTFLVATDRLYTAEGVWVLWIQLQGSNRVRLGVTDFMQQHNGDVAFVSLKPTGTAINVGDEFGEIETMKVTIGLDSPVAGKIVQINEAYTLKPETRAKVQLGRKFGEVGNHCGARNCHQRERHGGTCFGFGSLK